MKKTFRKTVSFFLAALMIFGSVPVSVLTGIDFTDQFGFFAPLSAQAASESTTAFGGKVYYNTSRLPVSSDADKAELPEECAVFEQGEKFYINFNASKVMYVLSATLSIYSSDNSTDALCTYTYDDVATGSYSYFRHWAMPIENLEPGSYTFSIEYEYSLLPGINNGSTRVTEPCSFEIVRKPASMRLSATEVNLVLPSKKRDTVYVYVDAPEDYDYRISLNYDSELTACYVNNSNPVALSVSAKKSCLNAPVTVLLINNQDGTTVDSKTVCVTTTENKYSVTFNTNGGTTDSFVRENFVYNEITVPNIIPQNPGYGFGGWTENLVTNTPLYKPGDKIIYDTDTTLHAVWTKTKIQNNSTVTTPAPFYGQSFCYYITLLENSGDLGDASATVVMRSKGSEDTSVTLYDSEGNFIASNDDGGDDKNFRLKYNLRLSETYTVEVKNVDPTSNTPITFSVGYTYTVSYDSKGGTRAPAPQTKDHGFDITVPDTIPQKNGYSFAGWSTSPLALTADYLAGSAFSANENKTLYAVWRKNNFSLTFDGNGYDELNSTVSGVSAYIIPKPDKHRTGYNLIGWSEDKNATTPTYLPGDTVYPSENTKLWAVWQEREIALHSIINVPINYPGQVYYYKFVCDTNEKFAIQSSGSSDTSVFLYNSQGELIASDENSGTDSNFRLITSLTVGETYYFGIRYYDSTETGIITVGFGKKLSFTIDSNNSVSGGIEVAPEIPPVTESETPDPSTYYYYGEVIILETDITNPDFLGWSENSEARKPDYTVGQAFTLTDDTVLYCIWDDTFAPFVEIYPRLSEIYLSASDTSGIAGYYFGKNPIYTANSYTAVNDSPSSFSEKIPVSSEGEHYLVVMDTYGNITPINKFNFIKTTLHLQNDSNDVQSIFSVKNKSVTIPIPSYENHSFIGWNTMPDGSGEYIGKYFTDYKTDREQHLYAQWDDTGRPQVKAEPLLTAITGSNCGMWLAFSDDKGVAGYYCGQNSEYDLNSFRSFSEPYLSVLTSNSLNSSGTWYIVAKDTDGNLSEPTVITIHKTVLSCYYNKTTTDFETFLAPYGVTITVPVPSSPTFIFDKCYTSPDATGEPITEYTVTGDSHLYYPAKLSLNHPEASASLKTDSYEDVSAVITLSDNSLVQGYYWGTDPDYRNNTYYALETPMATATAEQPITSRGTYYLTALDDSNAVSQTYSYKVYDVTYDVSAYPDATVTKNVCIFPEDGGAKYHRASRPGYSFLGWSLSPDSSSLDYYVCDYSYGAKIVSDSNLTLYPVFSKNANHLYLEASNGSDEAEKLEYHSDRGIYLPSQTHEKTYTLSLYNTAGLSEASAVQLNCTFKGWNTDSNGSGTAYQSGDFYNSNEDSALYAQWENPVVADIPELASEKKKFIGWTKSVDGEILDSDSEIDGDTVLYAKWGDLDTYTLSFDANGGTNAPAEIRFTEEETVTLDSKTPVKSLSITFNGNDGTVSTNKKTVNALFTYWLSDSGKTYSPSGSFSEKGDTVLVAQWDDPVAGTLPTAERYGYTFLGWYDPYGNNVTSSSVISKDTELTAAWRENSSYTVSFDANGGTNAPSPQTKYEGQSLTLTSETPVKYFTVNLNANGGVSESDKLLVYCGFDGWTDKKGNTYQPEAAYTQDENVTLYALWSSVTLKNLPIAEKKGCRFIGWYTQANGGTLVDENTPVTSDITVYAKYTDAEYTVSFMDGDTVLETKKMPFNTTQALKCTSIPYKKGYAFLGWAESKDANVKFSNNDRVLNLASKDGETVYLYAVWQKSLDVNDFTYSFSNSFSGFNYSYDYKISLDVCRNVFGNNILASSAYHNINYNGWNGNCFGMGTSSVMMNKTSLSDLSVNDFSQTATKVSGLKLADADPQREFILYSQSGKNSSNPITRSLTILDLIEILQVSQLSLCINNENFGNANDVEGMCKAIEQAKLDGKYPIIGVFDSAGHVLVPYDVMKVSDSLTRIFVYDCNTPYTENYIELHTDEKGNFTSWSYDMRSHGIWGSDDFTKADDKNFNNANYITYINFDEIVYVMQNLGNHKALNKNKEVNVMNVSSSDFEIRDVAGKLLGECVDGNFKAYDKSIMPVNFMDVNERTDSTLILPCDVYKVVDTSPSTESITVSMTDTQYSSSVSTTADEITFAVSDEFDMNSVTINAQKGDTYDLELSSSKDDAYENITLAGVSDGTRIDVSTKEDLLNVCVNNNSHVSVCIDGNTQQLPQSKRIRSISVFNRPDKLRYFYMCDKKFYKDGLELLVTYMDGSTKVMKDTSVINCYGFDPTTAGTQTITVEYGGALTSFDINISSYWWDVVVLMQTILEKFLY